METYFTQIQEELTAIRRDLHAIPEGGLQEYQTAAYIRQTLERFGAKQIET